MILLLSAFRLDHKVYSTDSEIAKTWCLKSSYAYFSVLTLVHTFSCTLGQTRTLVQNQSCTYTRVRSFVRMWKLARDLAQAGAKMEDLAVGRAVVHADSLSINARAHIRHWSHSMHRASGDSCVPPSGRIWWLSWSKTRH